MPALRKSLSTHRRWILSLGIAAGLLGWAIGDWTKPAAAQTSVQWFSRGVFTGYYQYVRPITSHFVRCRYQPTCSAYSVIAMQTYGFPKGLWLTVKRLCRCLPWVPMGTYDPVPVPVAAPAHHG